MQLLLLLPAVAGLIGTPPLPLRRCAAPRLPSDRSLALHSRGLPRPPQRAATQCSAAVLSATPDAAPTVKGPIGRVLRAGWACKRTFLIWSCVVGQALAVASLRRKKLKGEPLVAARRALAARLRDQLVRLGPTFIKIGQLLSTRVDVLPPEVINELARLQNEVPGFPAKRARAIIEEELGQRIDELFSSFTPEPIAAASLAQVHLAELKRTGEKVCVKVQRENLQELFDVDMWNIRIVAAIADRLDPQTEATEANWSGIADTSGEVLYREVDFHNERRSAQQFQQNFKDVPTVKVPSMIPELCSSRVLTMEYVPGVKISHATQLQEAGFDPVHISRELTSSYLEQVCRHGFFHCDPHPGNLAVDDGYPGGRLIYYDFGMMETVEERVKKGFVDLIFSIYENLPRGACDALEVMGVLRPGIDRFSIERIARDMLTTFQTTLASAENQWENQMTEEEKRAARRDRRARLGQDLFATQAERPFLFPPKFTFVFRAFSTIDGIGKSLDPAEFDLSRLSQPYLRELADLRDGSTATSALKELGRRVGLRPVDLAQVVTQPRVVSALHESVRRIEEGEVKLRVRALEVERQLERVELRQRFVGASLGLGFLLQTMRGAVVPAAGMAGVIATARGLLAQPLQWPLLALSLRLAFEVWSTWSGMATLEEQRKRFANEGNSKYDTDDVYAGF